MWPKNLSSTQLTSIVPSKNLKLKANVLYDNQLQMPQALKANQTRKVRPMAITKTGAMTRIRTVSLKCLR